MKELLINFLNKLIYFLIKYNFHFKIKGKKKTQSVTFNNLNELINSHFEHISEPEHPCKESLTIALNQFNTTDKIIILETGSSAWGTNSSELFDKFITYKNNYHRNSSFLYTCDLRLNPMLNLKSKVSENTYLICNDSVKCLTNLSKILPLESHQYLIYLDSYDLEYNNPIPSGLHGFNEFIAVIPFLKKGTVLIIDDSPIDLSLCPDYAKIDSEKCFQKFGLYPGKGMFIDPVITKFKNIKKIFHKYQIIYVVE